MELVVEVMAEVVEVAVKMVEVVVVDVVVEWRWLWESSMT